MDKSKTMSFFITVIISITVIIYLVLLLSIFYTYALKVNNVKKEQLNLKKQYLEDILDFSERILDEGFIEWKYHMEKAHTAQDQKIVDRIYKDKVKELLSVIRFDNNDGMFLAYELRKDGTYYAFYPTDFYKWNTEAPAFDVHGSIFLDKLIESAKQRKGFITYIDEKPSKGINVKKIANARFFEPWNWVIVSGFFPEDVDVKVKELKVDINRERNIIFIITGIISAIILAGFLIMGTVYINKNFK